MKRSINLEVKLCLIFILCQIAIAKTLEKSLLKLNINLSMKDSKLYEKYKFTKPNELRFKATQAICEKLEGWLKYLKISEETISVPSTFIKNKMFRRQSLVIPKINTHLKDIEGHYLHIPNDDMFWVSLIRGEIRISSSRKEISNPSEDNIFLSNLVRQDETTTCQGGIEDMGNFSEGFCFMIKFVIKGKHNLWEFCAESEIQKDRWMQCLIKSKINEQSNHNRNQPTNFNNYQGLRQSNSILSLKSGWVPEGNWSECSKKCGRGIQSRKLKCLKNNNLCQGSSIEERQCNIQKCKGAIDEHLENLKKVSEGQWEFLGKWSECSKPCGGGEQKRRRKCVSSLGCSGNDFVKKSCNLSPCTNSNFEKSYFSPCERLEGNLKLNNMINSHIVVDSNHIDIFTDQLLIHPVYSVTLGNVLHIENSKKSLNCLKIMDIQGKSTKLCGDDNSKSSKWKSQLEDFKYKCNINNSAFSFENSRPLSLDSLTKKVLEEEKILNKRKEAQLMQKFDDFKHQVNDLLHNEDKYERDQEDHEKEILDKEKEKMRSILRNEEKRANDLAAEMIELGKGDDFKIKEKAIKRKMKLIMNDIQKKIDIKRKNLANKLNRMKRLHFLDQKLAAKKLLEIKKNMGKKLANLNKKGNPNKCFMQNTQKQINDYCECNFKDALLNKECKDKNQFCYICCDNEIGKLNKENLDCCYNKCDKISSDNKCNSFSEIYHIKIDNHPIFHPHHIIHGHSIPHHFIHGHSNPHHYHVLHGHHHLHSDKAIDLIS